MSDFNLITDPDFNSSKYWHEAYQFKLLLQDYHGAIDVTSLNLVWQFYKAGFQAGWLLAGGSDE